MSSNQRPPMGPPETPSRFIQQSPNLFPSLQFSPDLYAHQFNSGPATAPIYPQQRLFWDSTSMPFEQPSLPPQYQDPFQMSPVGMSTSFASSSTVVPQYSQQDIFPEEQQPYDLPNMPRSMSFTQHEANVFLTPFTTSPRIPPPPMENPSMFLSSPARRFGTADHSFVKFGHPPAPDRPAYAHQIEESRREQEMKRVRRMEAKQPSITRSVMEALRRPVSPAKKDSRPGLKRSLTHTGVRNDRSLKVQTQNGRNSPAPGSFRPGRSSPLKSIADPISRTLTTSRNTNINTKRGSISLSIDENGVAKTILTDRDPDTDLDEALSSATDSFDESDFHILHSQHNSFAFHNDDPSVPSHSSLNRPFSHSKTNSHSTLGSTGSTKQSSYQSSQASYTNTRASDGVSSRRKRPLLGTTLEDDTLMEDETSSGNAQAALRAIIQDRSRSTSAQGDTTSHHLHSSPPQAHTQYATFNASPTTITDPDLATPSTDRDSLGSNMSTRCVCNSSLLDGTVPVIRW